MNLHNPTAEMFVPDGRPIGEALARASRLGIGAHQDDLEFMAFHGIVAAFKARAFAGVTCTNGAGSARTGQYASFTDAQMMAARRREQNAAATMGRYAVMIQLDYPSSVVKSATDQALKDDLKQVLGATRAQVVYTHNPTDKHDTHVGVAIAVLQAIRELPVSQRPPKVWGCEVWRDLDWLPDDDKVLMDVSGYEDLAAALNSTFESQIAGGKRYDLATIGRRRAHATFFESHATDKTTQLGFAMDLTPLVVDETRDIIEFVTGFIDKFRGDVTTRLKQRLGR
jgi:LmbE family N-acetylglucosaminyl deacetylase